MFQNEYRWGDDVTVAVMTSLKCNFSVVFSSHLCVCFLFFDMPWALKTLSIAGSFAVENLLTNGGVESIKI